MGALDKKGDFGIRQLVLFEEWVIVPPEDPVEVLSRLFDDLRETRKVAALWASMGAPWSGLI